jgi:hypothetical protein
MTFQMSKRHWSENKLSRTNHPVECGEREGQRQGSHTRRADQPVSLQLFEGNMHYDTPDIRRFDPVPAQYVRVYPERWSPAGIGMRLEVLGCDWTGKAAFLSWSHSLGLATLAPPDSLGVGRAANPGETLSTGTLQTLPPPTLPCSQTTS